jgi:pantothenate synthetase
MRPFYQLVVVTGMMVADMNNTINIRGIVTMRTFKGLGTG